ncbi:hypothetical protein [Natronolimnobius baerhuensis]|uniref:hypothetical protein n=1 Tax=Natronolimnobius baerhuensis TaxID=253108 RepID=UPI001595B549|nr:hypothetical protein [Natronolimnobius baerhuensis]
MTSAIRGHHRAFAATIARRTRRAIALERTHTRAVGRFLGERIISISAVAGDNENQAFADSSGCPGCASTDDGGLPSQG